MASKKKRVVKTSTTRIEGQRVHDEKQHAKELLDKTQSLTDLVAAEQLQHNELLRQRDAIIEQWEIHKEILKDRREAYKEKQRQIQSFEEEQQVEAKSYKLRLKELRFDQLQHRVDIRNQSEEAMNLNEGSEQQQITQLWQEVQEVAAALSEAEKAQDAYINEAKLQQDQSIMLLRKEFESDAKTLQRAHRLKMQTLRDAGDLKRKEKVAALEEEKTRLVSQLHERNIASFQRIKDFYTEITTSNMNLIKKLKKEHDDVTMRDVRDSKVMTALMAKNRALSEPLWKTEQDVARLKEELVLFEDAESKLQSIKKITKCQQDEIDRLDLQVEVLTQKLGHIQTERDNKYSEFQYSIYDVQQSTSLQNLILETKMDYLDSEMQSKATLISALIRHCDLGHEDLPVCLADDLVKQREALQYEAWRLKDARQKIVERYEAVLRLHSVPPEE